jgi:hypothetical protein
MTFLRCLANDPKSTPLEQSSVGSFRHAGVIRNGYRAA